MIKKTKWIETQTLGKCNFRHPMIVRADLIDGKFEGLENQWVVSCPTLRVHSYSKKRKEALALLGEIILDDLKSYRDSAPDGNTEDANELLRLLEALIEPEEEEPIFEVRCAGCWALAEFDISEIEGEGEYFCYKCEGKK